MRASFAWWQLLACLGLQLHELQAYSHAAARTAELPELPSQLAHSSDPAWHQQAAAQLVQDAGLGSRYAFAELAGPNVTLASLLERPQGAAWLVVVAGAAPPTRRDVEAGEPFLRVGPASAAALAWLPVGAINAAAGALEGVLRRPLFPLRLEVCRLASVPGGGAPAPPYAVFDASAGIAYLDDRVAQRVADLPGDLPAALGRFAEALFGRLAAAPPPAAGEAGALQAQGCSVAHITAALAPAAAAAAAAAITSQVPLWFCIACPAVLGLLAPFALNLGLGKLADALCSAWSLPAAECADLWYGAFALAMVLSFASAIPIVYLCRLPECAKRQQA